MTLMLMAIFAAAGVGLLVKDFGRRETLMCVGIAAGLTAIYFLRPYYMT